MVPVPLPTLIINIKMALGKKIITGILNILKRFSVLNITEQNYFLN